MKGFLAIILLLGLGLSTNAQDLEPRVYANLPKGVIALAANYAHTSGNVVTDPSLPITDLSVTGTNFTGGAMTTFGLGGKLARVQVILPYMDLTGNLKVSGQDTTITRRGVADLRIRLGINLIGSQALTLAEFKKYQQKTIVGFSLVITAPTGQYFPDKLANIGSNRWSVKPEIGASYRFNRVYAEAYSGIWFYTANNEFLVNKKREQEPIFSFQAHSSYYIKPFMWVGVNANWFSGGDTIIDGVPAGTLLNNWRVGVTWSLNVSPKHSFKLQCNIGAFSSAGYDYNSISLGYQYVFFKKS